MVSCVAAALILSGGYRRPVDRREQGDEQLGLSSIGLSPPLEKVVGVGFQRSIIFCRISSRVLTAK